MRASSQFLQKRTVLFAISIALVLLLTAAFWRYTQDDVFITYTYSRNIAQGTGFVFNPGEQVQGTTTPLWALMMAGVYRVTPDLLYAGNLIGGLLLLVVCLLAYKLLRAESVAAALAAVLLLATSPLNYASFGMETLLYSALLFLSFWLWGRQRRAWAMLAAAALTWTRADGAVLAAVFCLLALLESGSAAQRLIRATRLGLIYLAGIAPWFLFAYAYFGALLPNTFGAKQGFLQGLNFLTDGIARWSTFFGGNPLSLLALILIPLGLWQAWQRAPLRPLAVWAVLYTLGYTALNVTNFWYYTPLVNTLIVLAALGLLPILRVWPRGAWWQAGGWAILVLAAALNTGRALELAAPPPRMATYQMAGQWIAQHTPTDASLMVADLGIAGYYAQRRTLDSFGLIVPDMAVRTPEYATIKYKPDYILATQYFFWRYTAEDWFRALYMPIAQFTSEGDSEFSPMTLYQRRDALTIPNAVLEGTALPLSFSLSFVTGEGMPADTRATLDSEDQRREEFVQPFLAGRYPGDHYPQHDTAIEQIHLPVPASPGEYRWAVTAPVELEGVVELMPLTASPGYRPVSAEWPGLGRLEGMLLPETELWTGGSLRLLLEWRAAETISRDYTAFVHLVGEDGVPAAQHDGMPLAGRRPTTSWQAGERLIDAHEVDLPPDLPPGQYSLCIGWYDWQTLERVRLTDNSDALCGVAAITVRAPDDAG